jgi:cell division inhibitor SepF
MSVIDKFLDAMRLNEEDDEFYNDDYDYDYDDEEEVEEVKEKKPSRRQKKKELQERSEAAEVAQKRQKQSSKITPISRNRKQGAQGMEVCVIKPNAIDDEIEIAETLLNGRTVVINMEGLSVDVAQRIIDFTSGATFAMHGNLQKISNYIFLAAPSGIDISGDIDLQNIMDSFDIPGYSV